MSLNKKKTPWPTKKAMEQVYEMKLWGTNGSSFYSGEGSYNIKIVEPYLKEVKLFLSSFNPYLTICDLGCGDFNIGKELTKYSSRYFAVDIVSGLIEFNKRKYIKPNLEFLNLDISRDELPKADCAIVRQVLQHLSNNEVQNILVKLSKFKFLILTEHIPNGVFEPNLDIISGQGIRLKKNSGLQITKAPFYFNYKEKRKLSLFNLGGKKGQIVTTLYTI